MRPVITAGLLLLNAAATMPAEAQQEQPAAAEQAEPDYGLRPEDARRIEGMLERGETSSVESEEIAQLAPKRSVSTTVSVSKVIVDASLVAWLILLVSILVIVYVAARRVQRRAETTE